MGNGSRKQRNLDLEGKRILIRKIYQKGIVSAYIDKSIVVRSAKLFTVAGLNNW